MKISIIIPVFKAEKHIRRCLLSILGQSFGHFEVIIVDDFSPDKSIEIVRQFSDHDPRFRIVSHTKNRGPMRARETGYKNAKFEYLVFVDADDELTNNALEVLYNAITSNGSDIVISAYKSSLLRGKKIIKTPKLSYGSDSISLLKSLLSGQVPHCLWAKIYSKNLFKNPLIVYENQTNGEDLILFYQLANFAKKITAIDNITYIYHQIPGSITNKKITNKQNENLKIKWNFLDITIHQHSDLEELYNKYKLTELYKAAINNYDISSILCQKQPTNKPTFRSIRRHHDIVRSIKIYGTINSPFLRKTAALTHTFKVKIYNILFQ